MQTQNRVLRFITRYSQKHGVPPTRRQVAEVIGSTVNTAQYHIDALAEQGRLVREDKKARGIALPAAKVDPLTTLDQRAAYWQSLGCRIHWDGNPYKGQYTGFRAYWEDTNQLAQEVSLREGEE